MAGAHTLRFVLAALLYAGAALSAHALELGESKTRIFSRHGEPGAEDRGKGTAIYFWEGWSAELEFKNEVVHKLIYRRNTYLTETEVGSLLKSNGIGTKWRETTPEGEPMRQWVRDDGAVASCLALRPLMMTFQAREGAPPGVPVYAAKVSPQNVVPPVPQITSSTPPTFPKLLGSSLDSPPASDPAMSSGALPKLASEEIGSGMIGPRDSAPLPVAQVDPGLVEPETASGAVAVPPKTDSEPGGYGVVVAMLTLIGAIGAGYYYWFKSRKPSQATFKPVATAKAAPAGHSPSPAPLVTSPALDALRGDQYDLLVGEIFRRAGYTVELRRRPGGATPST